MATNDQLQDSLSPPLSVHTSDTQASHEPPPDLPILKRREPFNCPKNAEEWLVADEQLAKSVVPEVLATASVDEKNKALCDGIYTYFTSRYGTRPNKKQKKWKMKASGKALSKLRTERNKLRSEMRKARKAGQDPQAIKDLARKFHQLLRQHSKAKREVSQTQSRKVAQKACKECARDFWKFAAQVLDENKANCVDPDFPADTAEGFFTSVYSSDPRDYHQPEWLPDASPPDLEFDEEPISKEELQSVIVKSRSQSSPSPLDQIPYVVYIQVLPISHPYPARPLQLLLA